MTVEEIFSNIATHMAKGLLIHRQIASAYGFLNLEGYQKCHEFRYYEESKNYCELHNFFLTYYNKLIHENAVEEPKIIPSNWYNYTKQDVNTNNKRNAIKDLMKAWVDWEEETKILLENSYKQLCDLDEIVGALQVEDYIKDVSLELSNARKEQINLESLNYDIVYIIEVQEQLYKQYVKKIKDLYK